MLLGDGKTKGFIELKGSRRRDFEGADGWAEEWAVKSKVL